MVGMSLPPGFRFHPTDVELILYYLKRKIMGRKFHFEAIAEVNIYKYSPWDLPDKNLLKSKDLEWFFFCPREKKYASGVRVKRATENGYWKTTGKDRTISCNEKTVGTVKTLIFHLGHAPQGERTNWVIHEYRILDDQLAKAGVQDNYVLCKVFEKKGLGPKNGAQYGAPFSEEDWADLDDDNVAQNCAIPFTTDGPCPTLLMQNEEQSLPIGSGFFGSGNGSVPIPEEGPSSSSVVPSSMVAPDETTDDVMEHLLGIFVADNVSQNCDIPLGADGPCPTLLMQNEGQCLPLGTGLFGSGNGSLPKPKEGCSSSALVPARMVAEDDMLCLHGLVPDDDMLLSNGCGHNQDDLSGKGKKKLQPSLEGFDLYDGLHDLDIWTEIKEDRFNFSGVQNVDYSLNRMLPEDNSMYIELDDLLLPLDCSNGVAGTHLSSIHQLDRPDGVAGTHSSSLYSLDCSNGFSGTPVSHCQTSASYSLDNMQQLYSGTRFSSMHQYTFSANDPPVLPYSSEGGDILNGLSMVEDHLFNEGPNVPYNFDLPFSQLENAGNTPHDMMERGASLENVYARLLECCIPAHILPSAAASTCGGSSIHIKAEVTHGAGECTNDALSVMMEGSSSCRCNSLFHPWFALYLVSHLIMNAYLSHVYFCLFDDFSHSNCSLRYES